MSRRVFVTVTRGMTDKTAVCVFPWEIDLLSLVHGQEIQEVSIDQMCDMQGAVKIEKQRLKHTKMHPPSLREQLEAMVYVSPEDDPCNDLAAEYNRLGEKYGMDKEFPMPIVERIFGQFTSGAFEAKLKEYAKDRAPKPAFLTNAEDAEATEYGAPQEKEPSSMSREELRAALRTRGIAFKAVEGRAELAEKLEAALAPA